MAEYRIFIAPEYQGKENNCEEAFAHREGL